MIEFVYSLMKKPNKGKNHGKNRINTIKMEKPEYEYCILCRKLTDVSYATPISMRRHYVEGAGQLCESCFSELYGKGFHNG